MLPRRSKKPADPLWRLSGLGFELLSHILGGMLLGWVIDYFADTGHLWLIVGAIAGLLVGMTDFLRSALRAQKKATEHAEKKRTGNSGAGHPVQPPKDHDDQCS